jgi:hypothetical protein
MGMICDARSWSTRSGELSKCTRGAQVTLDPPSPTRSHRVPRRHSNKEKPRNPPWDTCAAVGHLRQRRLPAPEAYTALLSFRAHVSHEVPRCPTREPQNKETPEYSSLSHNNYMAALENKMPTCSWHLGASRFQEWKNKRKIPKFASVECY